VSETAVPQEEREAREAARRRITESILDNLAAWAFIAGAIALLYEVWATVRVLTKYVGQLPGVSP